MKHIEIIMPQVKACTAQACGFNKDMAAMRAPSPSAMKTIRVAIPSSPSLTSLPTPNQWDGFPASVPAR